MKTGTFTGRLSIPDEPSLPHLSLSWEQMAFLLAGMCKHPTGLPSSTPGLPPCRPRGKELIYSEERGWAGPGWTVVSHIALYQLDTVWSHLGR